jgi:hypothetical protein
MQSVDECRRRDERLTSYCGNKQIDNAFKMHSISNGRCQDVLIIDARQRNWHNNKESEAILRRAETVSLGGNDLMGSR